MNGFTNGYGLVNIQIPVKIGLIKIYINICGTVEEREREGIIKIIEVL